MIIWLLGFALAQDAPINGAIDDEYMPPAEENEPEPAPQKTSTDPEAQLIPGIQNAGLPPMAPATLPPPAPVVPVKAIDAAGLPPMVQPIPQAPQALPPPPPPLKTHQGLPPPPPPIEEAGLPPMAEEIEEAEDELE